MLGGLFAFLSATSFGFNNAALRRGVLNGSVFQALSITVPMGVPMFLVAAILGGQLGHLSGLPPIAYLWLAAAGVVHFVWGRYCNYRSTKAIGGNLSGPWRQAKLIVALVLAILLLGETLTLLKVFGIALIVLGVVATSRAKHKKKPKPEMKASPVSVQKKTEGPDFEPRYAEGYLFALLSATGYGVSPVLVRMGLENAGPGFSLLGGLVSYVAAAIAVGIVLLIGGHWTHVRNIKPVAARWFTLAGALVGISQMLRYAALSLAPVTVVTPIQSTSAVFRILFGWLINREYEAFGAWVYVGVLCSIAGVLALSLSVADVFNYVSSTGFLGTSLTQWHWR